MARPDETSPLLAKTVKSSDSISNHESEERNSHNVRANGPSRGRIDEESQGEDPSRETQYEGLPEVKKQLKYILPGAAIGVC